MAGRAPGEQGPAKPLPIVRKKKRIKQFKNRRQEGGEKREVSCFEWDRKEEICQSLCSDCPLSSNDFQAERRNTLFQMPFQVHSSGPWRAHPLITEGAQNEWPTTWLSPLRFRLPSPSPSLWSLRTAFPARCLVQLLGLPETPALKGPTRAAQRSPR